MIKHPENKWISRQSPASLILNSGAGPELCRRLWFRPNLPETAAKAITEFLSASPPRPVETVAQSARRRTTRADIAWDGEIHKLVIKTFYRRSSLPPWLINRAPLSKAYTCYVKALEMEHRGIGVATPLACVEKWAGQRLMESALVCSFLDHALSFRTILTDMCKRVADCEELMRLLQRVAESIRKMHDLGFEHRDLGNQNIFLHLATAATPDRNNVFFIDLDRGRFRDPLTPAQRARDLSRITLPSDLLRVFFDMYWGHDAPPPSWSKSEKKYRRRFALHTATRSWRHPLREKGKRQDGNEDYPSWRDVWVWDERSVQAIPVLKSRHRLVHSYPLARLTVTAWSLLRHGPGVWRRWRTTRKTMFNPAGAITSEGIAVAIKGDTDTLARELELLSELNLKYVFLRFYHHYPEADRRGQLAVFDQLRQAGFKIAGALVQDRSAILEPESWESFCLSVLRHVHRDIEWLEYGHAVNRVKWGIWGFPEYRRFAAMAVKIRRQAPDLVLTGPAVIDFEYDYLLGTYGLMPENFHWDALSLHLYVDRRGAPENYQGKFDTVEKLALASAIASSSGCRAKRKRVIVSEFNWPLQNTGVWSPVGSPHVSPGTRLNDPSVSEDEYADYLVRYLLLSLASGLVSDCVIWRLAAHGFGLVDDLPSQWRPRPAFYALKHLLSKLREASFVKALTPCRAPGIFALLYIYPDRSQLCVAWSHPAGKLFKCPFPPKVVYDIHGESMPVESNYKLDGSPLYFTDSCTEGTSLPGVLGT